MPPAEGALLPVASYTPQSVPAPTVLLFPIYLNSREQTQESPICIVLLGDNGSRQWFSSMDYLLCGLELCRTRPPDLFSRLFPSTCSPSHPPPPLQKVHLSTPSFSAPTLQSPFTQQCPLQSPPITLLLGPPDNPGI